jgi:predicted ATPase
MIVTRIELENWKNFHKCDVKMAERCFVVGANASGKSNFLDVFRFLRDITRTGGGLQTAVVMRGGMKKIRCLAARTRSFISISVTLAQSVDSSAEWNYTLLFKNIGGGIRKNEVAIIKEEVIHHGNVIMSRNEKDKREDSETLKYTYLEQPTANREFRELKFFFENIQYLNVVPQLVRESGSLMLSSDKEDYYGRNFIRRLSVLNEKTRNSYFKKINEVLRLAVPQLENLSLVPDELGVPHLEAKYVHWRAAGSKQQEDQFSDGTLRLIGFLFALIDSTGLTLLEEPETNLHSAIISQFPEFIAKIQRTRKEIRQVILTTHSFDILSNEGISGDEVIVLTNTPEGTELSNVNDIDRLKSMLKAGFSVADAVLPYSMPDGIDQMIRTIK